MLNGRNLVVDTFSEVYELLKPWTTHEFWDLSDHSIVDNSVYVIARKQFHSNIDLVHAMLDRDDLVLFFDNAAEGSWTLVNQLRALGLESAARQKKLSIIGGGDMEAEFQHIRYDHFLVEVLEYDENVSAAQCINDIFDKPVKPYKFLFLNGRARPHRKYLYEKLNHSGVLSQALWTMLDSNPVINRYFRYAPNETNLMACRSSVKLLPTEYEVSRYRDAMNKATLSQDPFVKYQLFDNEWGEIYIEPTQYIDTYFSLITETVFEYPYSFRTEKIARPLLMGHPWIVAGNVGYYRDLRNLGFKTFSHVIDESFDTIDNHQDRMDRIFDIVVELCNSDLVSFIEACRDTCKYNQQHLQEIAPQLKAEFPQRFFSLLKNNG